MKVEVLYFDGCPTYETATKTLRKVLSEEGLESDIEFVAVNTDEQARRLRFPGSPTIRVDGEDLFPVPDRAVYALGCQTYPTPEGPKGLPGAAMLTQALSRTFGNPSSGACTDAGSPCGGRMGPSTMLSGDEMSWARSPTSHPE